MNDEVENKEKKSPFSTSGGIVICLLLLVWLCLIILPKFIDLSPLFEWDRQNIICFGADITLLDSQLELYRAQIGKYPSSLSDLIKIVPAGVDVNGDGVTDEKDTYGPWLKAVPLQADGSPLKYDPKTGQWST